MKNNSLFKKRFAVLGLARSGLSLCRFLKKNNCSYVAFDSDNNLFLSAKNQGINVVSFDQLDWSSVDILVVSPGISSSWPQPNEFVFRARKAGVYVTCDVELFVNLYQENKMIGITGTNGKSTTTALLGHVLKTCGLSVVVGGNIGVPVFDLDVNDKNVFCVLELSSYQLELMQTHAFDTSIFLNITPDHLVRHFDMNGYVAAKERIFLNQNDDALRVVGRDDVFCEAIYQQLRESKKDVVGISFERRESGTICVEENIIFDGVLDQKIEIGKRKYLRGDHNAQNIAAVFAAASRYVKDVQKIVDAILSFPGLEHRQEFVATCNGVDFINDSKATNADASIRAIKCFENIFWIAGGLAKEDGIDSIKPYFHKIKKAFLIGDAAVRFEKTLSAAVDFLQCETLDVAVEKAYEEALMQGGGVVLLSPACASFDQFKSFEERGDFFKKCVMNICHLKEKDSGTFCKN